MSVESESSDEEDEPVKVTFSSLPKPSFHAFSAYDSKIKNLKLTSLTKVIPVRSQVIEFCMFCFEFKTKLKALSRNDNDHAG